MSDDDKKQHNIFLYIIGLSSLAVILIAFYSFYFKKDYNFIVETSCDNTTETCQYRDCSIEGDCPPNNLSYYNTYTIKASDFATCTNEDCTQACKEGIISCEKTECTENDIEEGICVVPVPVVEIPEPAVPPKMPATKSKK